MGDLLRFALSIGGALVALLIGIVWLLVRSNSRGARRFLLFVVCFFTVISLTPVSRRAANYLAAGYMPLEASDVPPGPTAIVVLGSSAFTAHDWAENRYGISDPMSANRVIEAVRVFRLLDAKWVISSGGTKAVGDWALPSGAAMREDLVRLGVPDSRILVETRSLTTHDEAVIVAEMLTPLSVANVVIVTTDIHIPRSLGSFRAVGLNPIPAPARRPQRRPPWDISFIPSQSGLDEFGDVAHEVAGIAWYSAKGWYRR